MELYTVEEVAEKLRLSVGYVRGLCRDGKMKSVKIGHVYRISEQDMVDYIDSLRNSQTG